MTKPMLAKSSNIKKIDQFVNDPDWYFQQKLDGNRILITVDDGAVSGVGRSGRAVSLPQEAIDPFVNLVGTWRFDGEFVGTGEGVLWLFDMPEAADVVSMDTSYANRAFSLETVYAMLFPDGSDDIKVADVARTTEEKQMLLDWCRTNCAEGVMMKEVNAKYLPGARSPFCLKAKFTETVDCVVLEVGREGKESVAVGAYHDGVMTEIGAVKMTISQGLNQIEVGDVIETRYLYVDKKMRLVQPVFLQFRRDKPAEDCNTDQLKYTDKTVRLKERDNQ